MDNLKDFNTKNVDESLTAGDKNEVKANESSPLDSVDLPNDQLKGELQEDISKPKLGKHVKTEKEIPAYERHSKRMRKNLKIAIGILIAVLVLICVLCYFLYVNANNTSTQLTQNFDQNTQSMSNDSEDATAIKTVTIPQIASYIGQNVDSCISGIGHGAEISTDRGVDEEGNPVKRSVKLSLKSDTGDSSAGTPSITLDLDEAGNILHATYSASIKNLGYSQSSFYDAITNGHIIEKTLSEAGLKVEDNVASLPENESEYRTYLSDGTTTSKEEREFSGKGTYNSDEYSFSSTLVFDYTISSRTGNLSDTLKTITFTISK